MHINLSQWHTISQDVDGNVFVTRPTMFGGIASHIIPHSPYDAFAIAKFLWDRMQGTGPMAQDAFPKMNEEDREFLISGITPQMWKQMAVESERFNVAFGGTNVNLSVTEGSDK